MLYILHGHGRVSGGFASISPALDIDDETGNGRQVAVKRQLDSSRKTEFSSRLFERERSIWCSLPPHPGIISALRADRVDGDPILVLDYVYGASLDKLLQSRRPFSPPAVLVLLLQLSAALRHLHETSSVWHGDLMPQNLLFDGTGRVRVADLGLAQRAGDTIEVSPIDLAVPAPEQVGNPSASPQADVWAAGFCAIAAIRGEAPSRIQFDSEAFSRPATVDDAIEGWRDGVNDDLLCNDLRALLIEMISKDPALRIQDGQVLHANVMTLIERHARWKSVLDEERHLRRELRHWVWRGPSNPHAAFKRLQEIGSRLLGPTFVTPQHRLMPESPYLLARASWISYLAFERNHKEFAEFGAAMAARSNAAFPEDPRPLALILLGGRETRAPDRNLDLRYESQEVDLFERYGSFVRAQQVRDLVADLEQYAKRRPSVKRLLQRAHATLAVFDERLVEHYRTVEKRLPDALLAGI